jgi:hypothetical protein
VNSYLRRQIVQQRGEFSRRIFAQKNFAHVHAAAQRLLHQVFAFHHGQGGVLGVAGKQRAQPLDLRILPAADNFHPDAILRGGRFISPLAP